MGTSVILLCLPKTIIIWQCINIMTKQELSKLLEEKLGRIASKKDFSLVREQMKAMESRLMARFDELFNYIDKNLMKN